MTKNAVLNLMGVQTVCREEAISDAPQVLAQWLNIYESSTFCLPLVAKQFIKRLEIAFKMLYEGDFMSRQLQTQHSSTTSNGHNFIHSIELPLFDSEFYYKWKQNKLHGEDKDLTETELSLIVRFSVGTDFDFNVSRYNIETMKIYRLGHNTHCNLDEFLDYLFVENSIEQIVQRLYEILDIFNPMDFKESFSLGAFAGTPLEYAV